MYMKQHHPSLTVTESRAPVHFQSEGASYTPSDDDLKVQFFVFPKGKWSITGSINPKVRQNVTLHALINFVKINMQASKITSSIL